VRFLRALLITASLGSGWPGSGHSQQAATMFEFQSGPPTLAGELKPTGVTVPDSVRQKVGYQHWRGGAIGGALGAVAGLLLSKYPIGCRDCSPTGSDVIRGTFIMGGLAGAFGFLVGASSPRYEWRPAPPDTCPGH
jgi:hypothetical protein